MNPGPEIIELTAVETAELLRAGKIMLVDVREPQEYAADHIAGAQSMPLSQFAPEQLHPPAGQELVFHCGIGRRSKAAVERCAELGLPFNRHMQGGLAAWRAYGLPTTR